jgi:CheY-like chemotaxis protein
MFDRIEQVFRPQALERGLELRLRSDGEVAWSDPSLLEQVLGNLVSNAIRATARGGVLVAVRQREGALRFEVWDTGVGIAQDDLRRIFDEYVQLDNPGRDRRKGLGLGLSIAKRSAALIDARIAVVSRLGRGSRFSFVQPSAAGRDAEVPAAAAACAVVRRAGLPVLLVEDDEDVRLAFTDLLQRWGVPVEACADADAARGRLAAGERFGLLISDQRLGSGASGLDLITGLPADLDDPPPALLITGDWDRQLIQSAEAAGVPILQKPVQPAQLRAILGLDEAVVPA